MMMLCPPATALLAPLDLSSPSPSPPPSSSEFSLPRLPDFFPLRKRHHSCSRNSDLSTRLAAIQSLDTLAAPSQESIIHNVDPSLSPPTLLRRFATHAPVSIPHGDEFIRYPQLVGNQEIGGVHGLLTDTGVGSFKTSLQHAEDAEGSHDIQTTETILESSDRVEDDSIVQNEKLRRMRISEANRLQVPWNKGRSYKQEIKLSSEKKDIVLNTSNLDDDVSLLKKEKLRRQRIARANKGKVPWNKGRQHSEETRKRIRERTMEAMKNPEIREKLRIHGSTLSSETRSKISSALALLWDTRKKKKKAQETLIEEWREMIADTARKGYGDELAYEWNSYNIILKEMQHAWSLNRKKRKKKETGSGLSADHRIKISNAIKSKWANIEYRNTVTAGIHARWAKQGRDVTQRSRRNLQKKEITIESENKRVHVTLQKKNADDVSDAQSVVYKPIPVKKLPTYKNPSSIEMVKKLKHIREIRALEDIKRREATERARILMAEAQRATRALEAAAAIDESALGPLKEAQKLLAEAAESFKNAGLEMEDALNCE